MNVKREMDPCPKADALEAHMSVYELGSTLVSVCTRQQPDTSVSGWVKPEANGIVTMEFDGQPDEAALDKALSEFT